MEFQVGDKVRVKPNANRSWGDGSVCTVNNIWPTGRVSVKHPRYKNGTFDPSGLQYMFQEGDIVRLTCQCHKGLVGRVDGPCKYSGPDYDVTLDGWTGEIRIPKDKMELVDRAPRSDAEQCCNAEPEQYSIGDRVRVTDSNTGLDVGDLGTVIGFTAFCGEPHVKVVTDCNDQEGLFLYTEIEPYTGVEPYGFAPSKPADNEFAFPVDPTAENEGYADRASFGCSFEIFLIDGTEHVVPEDELVSFTRFADGHVEVVTTTGFIASYEPGGYTFYSGPRNKAQIMVEAFAA